MMSVDDKCGDDFAIPFVWQAHDTDLGDLGMCEQTILDLEWVDILAAADDEVFYPTSNADIAFVVDGGFIASVHPDFTVGIGQHHLSGLFRLTPVLLHDQVATYSQFASLANIQDISVVMRVDDFGFDVRKKTANSVDAFFDWIVGCGHGGDGRGFSHAVAYGEFCQVEGFVKLAHQFRGDGGACGDSSAEVLEAFIRDSFVVDEFEFGEEHGRYAVEGGAFFFLDGLEGCHWVKPFSREHYR